MTPGQREGIIILGLLVMGLLLQAVARWQGFLYIPVVVLLPVVLVWVMPTPLRYLVPLLIAAELLATLPAGIISGIVLLPLATFWLRGRVEPDVSVGFAFLLGVTVLLQFLTLFSYDLWQAREVLPTALWWQQQFPWSLLSLSWLATSGLAGLCIVGIVNMLPHEQRSIISLEGYRLHD